MKSAEKSFASHILRYVGVGLISGSIVHAGTLGGHSLRYTMLIILGIVAFTIGTYLESDHKLDKKFLSFIFVSVLISIGTGMVSGGTQHYLDGPVYAATLVPFGLLVSYFAYMWREYKGALTRKKIAGVFVCSLLLFGVLYGIAKELPESSHHHQEKE